jgi:hypothetical protein
METTSAAVDADGLILLRPGRWYGWTMYPGYVDGPYRSPILIEGVRPMRSGRSLLRLRFINALYAAGVRDFHLKLRVLFRTANALSANIQYSDDGVGRRMAVIEELTPEWVAIILRRLPETLEAFGDDALQRFVGREVKRSWATDYG